MGINRSPTSARVAEEIAQQRGLDIKMFYGGYDFFETERTSKEYFDDYNLIFVMEDYMEQGLVDFGISKSKIRCLYIPDEYNRDDPVLIKILRDNLPLYVREEPL